MYLSRVMLDITRRDTMLALQNPAMFHGAVERAFEPRACRSLWRLDTLGERRCLLLLSEEKPRLTALAAQFGTEEPPETRDYAPLLERIAVGSRWQFRLHANPTYSSKSRDGRGKVHACTLVRKPEKCRPDMPEPKTQVEQFNVTGIRWYAFTKKTGERVRLLGVTYEGLLTVTDVEKFREALLEGVGRGKAYGMGLLTVMRP